MDVDVDRCPNLRNVNDMVEIQRAWRPESSDGSPPVLTLLTRLAIVIAAAQPDGVGVDVGGAAERGRARQPSSVIRHIREQIEQDVRRRRDAGRVELVPLRDGRGVVRTLPEPANSRSISCLLKNSFQPLDPASDWEGTVYYAKESPRTGPPRRNPRGNRRRS